MSNDDFPDEPDDKTLLRPRPGGRRTVPPRPSEQPPPAPVGLVDPNAPADVAAPPKDAKRTESGLAWKRLKKGKGKDMGDPKGDLFGKKRLLPQQRMQQNEQLAPSDPTRQTQQNVKNLTVSGDESRRQLFDEWRRKSADPALAREMLLQTSMIAGLRRCGMLKGRA